MKKIWLFYILVLASMVIALAFSIALGAANIPFRTVVSVLWAQIPGTETITDWTETSATILLQVRVPHTILIALTGAALAGSGAAYQGLFRNPLADSYLIGVASGAGLGAVIALSMPWASAQFGLYLIPVAAFIGAILTVTLVYSLARVNGYVPTTTLLLAGVAVGAFASALTSFFMLKGNTQVVRALAFMLGGSPVSGWKPVIAVFPYMLLGLGLLAISGHPLNVLQFGEDQARQMGLNAGRTKIFLIAVASLTTAAAVSFSGVIGFIGLIIPHLFRLLWGSDYRHLIPLSMLGGVTALLLADILARTIIAPQSLPIGIVTSLAGAPFFLWILRRAKRVVFW